MAKNSKFLQKLDKSLKRKPHPEPTEVYGYPVKSAAELGVDEYFKANPNVAGMAMGGGFNGTSRDAPRTVVANPYSPHLKDPEARKALYILEASRHVMDEYKFKPKFELTPSIQRWRKRMFKPGTPYAEDDDAFRETVLSRHIVGDEAPDDPAVMAEVEAVRTLMDRRAKEQSSFLKRVGAKSGK